MRSECSAASNRVSAVIRSAKRQSYRDMFFKTRNNAPKLGSIINQLRGCPSSERLVSLTGQFDLNVASLGNGFNHYVFEFSNRHCAGIS